MGSTLMGPGGAGVAVIGGSSRGLGRAAAEAFVREGASVVVSSRAAADAQAVAGALDPTGKRALGLACDVGDLAQVQALSAAAIAHFGHYDVWVNNAGLSAPYGPMADIPPEAFVKVLQTNVIGTYQGCHVALQHLLARGQGTLINILGRGDGGTVPMQLAYSSSKWWMKAFTRTLAKENEGKGVAIMGFNPGLMTTDFLGKLEALEGNEAAMAPLKTVVRMWGNPPTVPAERLVALASAGFAHRNGYFDALMTGPMMLGGAMKEGLRRLTGRTGGEFTLNVKSVKPVERRRPWRGRGGRPRSTRG